MEVLGLFRPCFLHDANTSIDMEVKLPEAIDPKVGHGPKMGQ